MGAATLSTALSQAHRRAAEPIAIIVIVLCGIIILSAAWDEYKRRR